MADWPNPEVVVVPPDDALDEQRPVIMIGDVVATLLTREDPSEPVQYTSHPIESGEEITDYAIDLPKRLTLDCEFYSDPVIAGVNRQDAEAAAGGPLTTWAQKRDAIKDYKDKRTPIEVFTGYQLYPDRRIEDIILNRTPRTSNKWAVTLVFNLVQYVDQAWSAIPLDRIPKNRQTDKLKKGEKKGAPKAERGAVPAPEVVVDEDELSWFRSLGV